jgi:AcrR family transcriptional regulator
MGGGKFLQKTKSKKGQQTKDEIVKVAAQIASIEGLEGMTIGRLSSELNLSKSGLFGHFGSKEILQLEVINYAFDVFYSEVMRPVEALPASPEKFRRIFELWLDYIENDVFKGGCNFVSLSAEYDCREGEVRDVLVGRMQAWMAHLLEEGQACLDHLSSEQVYQTVFEVHSYILAANLHYKLFNNREAFKLARQSIQKRLTTQGKEE